MATAISALTVVGGAEQHYTIMLNGTEFVLRDTDPGAETSTPAYDVVATLIAPFADNGPAFVAVIDHAYGLCDIGFAARRYRGAWTDITAPDAPHAITWEDVENELWAALLRLQAGTSEPLA